jgi:hypothetical protein
MLGIVGNCAPHGAVQKGLPFATGAEIKMDRQTTIWALSFLMVIVGLGVLVYVFLRKRGLALHNAALWACTIAFVPIVIALFYLVYLFFHTWEF